MKQYLPILLILLACCPGCKTDVAKAPEIAINVSFSEVGGTAPLNGRLLLMLSDNEEEEPRFQINDRSNTQLIFGMNAEQMSPGETHSFGPGDFGYPYASLSDVPPGDYWVQALLHVYETFDLATGHR
ncbi:MAG: hypothetical protein KJN76_06405, partial [Eudoraea sp.]|nr:hypothetical protein [Eudoraea sp.]